MLAKKKKSYSYMAAPQKKSPKQLERHLKGVANHRRIDILFMISNNKGITVENIAERLNCNFKTISVHLQKLVQAGLVRKAHKGRAVTHELSPYGKTLYKFLRTFQHS